jgi:hypothetical protein
MHIRLKILFRHNRNINKIGCLTKTENELSDRKGGTVPEPGK